MLNVLRSRQLLFMCTAFLVSVNLFASPNANTATETKVGQGQLIAILQVPSIQKELLLTNEQIAKIAEINQTPIAVTFSEAIKDYLEDVFLKLSQAAQHSPQGLELGSPLLLSLLPDRWAATHPEHVHHDRIEEKRQAAENKLFYRLQAGLAANHPYAATASLTTTAE